MTFTIGLIIAGVVLGISSAVIRLCQVGAQYDRAFEE